MLGRTYILKICGPETHALTNKKSLWVLHEDARAESVFLANRIRQCNVIAPKESNATLCTRSCSDSIHKLLPYIGSQLSAHKIRMLYIKL